VTTGPLGMGFCNAVGLAMVEKHLAARFNKPDCEIVDHYTYSIMGDGCNMEVGLADVALQRPSTRCAHVLPLLVLLRDKLATPPA